MAVIKRLLLVLVFMSYTACDVSATGCPENSKLYRDICYTRNSTGKHWQDANIECKTRGGQLARIDGNDINDFLYKTYRKGYKENLWIGLRRCSPGAKKWCYPDGKASVYSKWEPKQPDGFAKNQDCVEMWPKGDWNDRRCDTRRPYICQMYSRTTSSTKTKVDLGQLTEEVDELYRKNISNEARKEGLRKIIDELSNITDLGGGQTGMDPQFLTETVEILQKILNLNISDGSLNILGLASNILDRRNRKSWRNITDEKVIRNLVITLENYGFQYGENSRNNTNASPIFQNRSNVQLRVQYIKHVDELSPEERLFKFPNALFNISPYALRKDRGAMVVVLWYKTLHSFLRNSLYGDAYSEISSKIISASVRPEPRMPFTEPVRISWDTDELNENETCAYWKTELSENRWKTDGCKRGKSNSNRLICECNHLTAFAVMDISRDMVSEAERQSLELISTIGCSVSLLGVFLTILTHALLWKRFQQNARCKIPSKVLMHLCVAIGMTNILAILAGPAVKHETFCITVSILLYFFVLALFGWMLCEGIIIYLQLVNVYTGLGLGKKHLKAFYIIGWGIPVIVVSMLVGLSDREDFITKDSVCWCRGGGVLFWTFVGTVCLILLINSVIFILALRNALSCTLGGKTKGTTAITKGIAGTMLRKARIGLKGSSILLPLLGLTWVFGLLVFNRDTIVFKYLFAICNSLQGLMIFVFHVLINRRFMKQSAKKRKFAMPDALPMTLPRTVPASLNANSWCNIWFT